MLFWSTAEGYCSSCFPHVYRKVLICKAFEDISTKLLTVLFWSTFALLWSTVELLWSTGRAMLLIIKGFIECPV